MKERVLFITFNDINGKYGGAQCTKRNFDCLSKRYDVDLKMIYRKTSFHSLLSLFCLLFPPLALKDIKEIHSLLKSHEYTFVFVDSSLFGRLVKTISLKYSMKVVVFMHNVEVDYINVRFNSLIRKIPYRILAVHSEKISLKYAHKLIVLNQRDKKRLLLLYGRDADLVFPITFSDTVDPQNNLAKRKPLIENKVTCLFVGALGRANFDGVKWFIENVLDKIDITLFIVGKNFEMKRDELSRENVVTIGTVEDLSYYYLNTDFVVSPIFSGGGMKVKIAEALMYGTYIFGTREAFEGYDIDYCKVGGYCNSADEFIRKIKEFVSEMPSDYNSYARRIFVENYSTTVKEDSFYSLLNE